MAYTNNMYRTRSYLIIKLAQPPLAMHHAARISAFMARCREHLLERLHRRARNDDKDMKVLDDICELLSSVRQELVSSHDPLTEVWTFSQDMAGDYY
jgi:hypothetical protein